MAGLTTGGPNLDVSLLDEINGLSRHAPGAVDRAVGIIGEYGFLAALVLLFLWCWRGLRRQDEAAAVESFAALVWAPLGAAAALLVNIPLREFVGRPRPLRQQAGVEVLDPGLVLGRSEFSFVSDHATLAMALAVGLFVANRKLGYLGIGVAMLEGLCRIYMGVHYPTDVIGGLALGTAVVLLFAPLAMALLTPVVRTVVRSPRLGVLVRARARAVPLPVDLAQAQTAPPGRGHESDLAA
ncbi:phosphatase PAP2 family protein [Streptomyces sp. NPDC060028]|uniref:phosphatase PAP2 family protein n=1 Tax=Streptomyces sp. NPDC060028 TaxID=3347041 RepID=UPI0036AC4396